jgi:hypothetical protein
MPSSVSRFSSPALLVVDMQNDFVREGAPMEVPDARASLESHRRLISCFRGIGAPVVYTKFLATDTPSLLWLWSPKCEPPTSRMHRRGSRDLPRARRPRSRKIRVREFSRHWTVRPVTRDARCFACCHRYRHPDLRRGNRSRGVSPWLCHHPGC